MRIAIDARAFSWTGIGRYIQNLLRELAVQHTDHTYIVLVGEGKIDQVKQALGSMNERFELQPVEPSYYSWKEQMRFLQQLCSVRADLFHFTHFNIPLLYSLTPLGRSPQANLAPLGRSWKFRKPYVVTIHDTTRFVFPGQKRQRLLEQIGYELAFSRAVQHAQAVICVSNATMQKLHDLPFNIQTKTQVIYEGIDNIFFRPVDIDKRQKIRMLLGTRKPYLLYVGVWMSHKNLQRLLEAFKIVRQTYPELMLVVTGKPVPGYINVVELAQTMNLASHVIFPGFVSHELLSALYAESECFVFPSLYEGFGLPPLEAAACGTPVVASNVSSLPEAMGDAAQYVNPESMEDIARGILCVLTDSKRREALIRMGVQHSQQFQWADTANKHLNIYEQVLNG